MDILSRGELMDALIWGCWIEALSRDDWMDALRRAA